MMRRKQGGLVVEDRSQKQGGRFMERLEGRMLMSVGQIYFPTFATTTGLVGNGYLGAPITNGTNLHLTDPIANEERTVWYSARVPIDTFTTHFTYLSDANASSGDGFTFTLQNGSTAAVGGIGADLGYGAGTLPAQSIAVAFNFYNLGNFGSKFGFTTGGVTPTTVINTLPVDLHSGATFNVTITYDGSNLTATITDASDSAKTFTSSEPINLRNLLGTDSAIVGFTAATGNAVSTQDISSWDFTGNNGISIATAAAATPTTVTGNSSDLTVLAAELTGEGSLTYTWSTVAGPTGSTDPRFTLNGTNAAKATTVRFYKDGTYHLRVTAADTQGMTVTSDVYVTVVQTPTGIRVRPHKAHIAVGGKTQYSALVYDQFNRPLRAQPAFRYAVTVGTGTINALTGLFRAPKDSGHSQISASADSLEGIAGALIFVP